jgi:hypothetical protein
MTNKKRTEAKVQALKDDLAILRHPPGSVRRDLEIWLIAERKKDEAAALRKQRKAAPKPMTEDLALHAVKTAHGLLKSVHAALPAKSQDPALFAGRSKGTPDWQRRGHTLEEVVAYRRRTRGQREYLTSGSSLRITARQ